MIGVLISSSVGGVVCASVGATEVALENLIRGSENKAGDCHLVLELSDIIKLFI